MEGSLNIFQFISESEVEIQIDKGDSRTTLFQEVLWSIQDKGTNFLFGGGASAGYQTDFFKEAPIVGNRVAPLGIVVVSVVFRLGAPPAATSTVRIFVVH